MLIGVDFDNTIVRYDDLFHRVARERSLIPAALPATKTSVRDYLRREGREDEWTALQGDVYGPRMADAAPFPGVIEFLARCVREGIGVRIVSHKTRHPFLGPRHDLHQSARDWLIAHRFFEPDGVNLAPEQVFFELTKSAKLQRIGALGCTHFIDDLPEFLLDAEFPAGVERILFDPGGAGAEHGLRRVDSWPAVAALVMDAAQTSTLPGVVRRLLDLPSAEPVVLEPVAGGGNNRGFRLSVRDRRYFVKAYFHDAHDTRDRLEAEFAFSSHAWALGVRALPQPIASDPGEHIGIYEFVDGERVTAEGATADRVRQAIDFHRAVNQDRDRDVSGAMGDASEACFSLEAHARTVAGRVRRVESIDPQSTTDAAAAEFVRTRLGPAWQRVLEGARRLADASGLAWDDTLAAGERVRSASDFGFHNALVRADGRLAFVDFEYAGWDDPAKLVSDFFCQPAVPVSPAYRAWFLDAVFEGRPGGARGRARADVVWPMYQIKWVCILLNEFLPQSGARRRFARPAGDWEARKGAQLEKARITLDALASAGAHLS